MTSLQPDEKVCPYCAEVIKTAAVKCRYCQSELAVAAPVTATATVPSESPEADTPSPAAEAPAAEASPFAQDRDAHPPQIPFLASFRLLVALVLLCLVLSCVAGLAWWRSEHPEDGAAPDGAITSTEARDEGMAAAGELTSKVLSYDWKTLDKDSKASQAVLAPSFRSEYEKTMSEVRAEAVKNQVKLEAEAAATSIVSATQDKVVALVFVNQVTTAKGSPNRRVDSSRVLVTLTRNGGDWRISKLKPF
jgi:hypothetical protein